MSCCGYHTLGWYYTYPSHPYKYVQVQSSPPPPKPGMLVEFRQPTKESYTPLSQPSSWYDLGMGWYNAPVFKSLR